MNVKKLIFDNITEQFEANGIKGVSEMFIILNKDCDKAEIRLKNICDKYEKIDYPIEKKNILLKVFLNKLKKIAKEKGIEPKSYTVRVILKNEQIEFFVKDNNSQIHTIEI
jgi:sucrose-6-phosphate hydrolase SacC (GH32 family)